MLRSSMCYLILKLVYIYSVSNGPGNLLVAVMIHIVSISKITGPYSEVRIYYIVTNISIVLLFSVAAIRDPQDYITRKRRIVLYTNRGTKDY